MDQHSFLLTMHDAATSAKHPWPEYAACEAAYDSEFDQMNLVARTNNPFMSRPHAKSEHPLIMVTGHRTWNGKTTEFNTSYLKFETLASAFTDRIATLKKYRSIYYGAVNADTAEEFVMQVSARWMETDAQPSVPGFIYTFMGKNYRWNQGRWSANPARAAGVLALYEANKAVFA